MDYDSGGVRIAESCLRSTPPQEHRVSRMHHSNYDIRFHVRRLFLREVGYQETVSYTY